ncbi:MAG TPA: transglutaminase family protein [Pseudonocardiaceae bacterium]
MSWQLRVVHSTGYRYETPAAQSFNEVRLTPRADRRQALLFSRIETTPTSKLFRYTDYWGTVVSAFDVHAPHNELKVVASSVVETANEVVPVDHVGWDGMHDDEVLDRYAEFLQPTRYTPADRELTAISRKLRRGKDPAEAVLAAAQWAHKELTYQPGSTHVHSSASDAMRAREGVCQDYAHVTLVLLRAMGIPARYVSGYLHSQPEAELGEVVRGESHAWIEAWTGGWWPYDPTNAIPIGERHVWVAVGRDYADVAPLKGIYSGGHSSALEVSVDVTRLA